MTNIKSISFRVYTFGGTLEYEDGKKVQLSGEEARKLEAILNTHDGEKITQALDAYYFLPLD